MGGGHRYDLCAKGIESAIDLLMATKRIQKNPERTFKQFRENGLALSTASRSMKGDVSDLL
jgi:hypothetical protein